MSGKFAGLESLGAARDLRTIDLRLERRSLELMGPLRAKRAFLRGHCALDELTDWSRLDDLSVASNRELSALQGIELKRLHLGNVPALADLLPVVNPSVRELSLYNLSGLTSLDGLHAFDALEQLDLSRGKALDRPSAQRALRALPARVRVRADVL